MKNIPLNKYEYYGPKHRTRKAYRKLIDLRNKHYLNQLFTYEYIEQVERIIFNEIPTKDLKYFGARPYFTILKELENSVHSDAAAYRLKTDLLTVY